MLFPSVTSTACTALEGFTEALTREMPPEWNIKGIIIQPGSFQTEWGNSSVRMPHHPAYDEHSPGAQFHRMLEKVMGHPQGEPSKAAIAMMRIASEPDPPLRLQLGTDGLGLVMNKASMTLRDAEKWAELSHSTNRDGQGSGPEVLEKLREAL